MGIQLDYVKKSVAKNLQPQQYTRDPASTQALRDYASVLNQVNGLGIIGAQPLPVANRVTALTKGGGGSGGGGADTAKALENLRAIAGYNAQSTKDQFGRTMANYDLADQQNQALANVQIKQNQRRAAADRFGQNKKLQAATSGILSAAGNALNGSGLGGLIEMLRTRNDLDNTEVINTLTQNKNAVLNALTEAINSNTLARNEAASDAEFALRNLEADLAAQISNIDPKKFVAPGTGDTSLGSTGFASSNQRLANLAQLAGYITQPPTKQVYGSGSTAQMPYFQKLLDSYSRRTA